MTTITQASEPNDFKEASKLTKEYLEWANIQSKEYFKETLDIDAMLAYSLAQTDQYLPPKGRLLLAKVDSEFAGIAFLKRLSDTACEIKRMFVRPGYRGKKIGYNLMEKLISDAKESGYSEIKLDSANFMVKAHELYRVFGFKEIEIYPGSEVGEQFQKHMVFMGLDL
ncbi:MAG: GNAT superfamily N-acetyltransferase [Saprospiraceae bacterium]|jgi:GNAT superfamily N-acetyltransferase